VEKSVNIGLILLKWMSFDVHDDMAVAEDDEVQWSEQVQEAIFPWFEGAAKMSCRHFGMSFDSKKTACSKALLLIIG